MSISAMKQAIQALEFFCEYGVIDRPFERIAELKQAITEAEKQEPVAWIVDGEIKVRLDMAGKLYYSETNVYAAPVIAEAEKQEPVIPAAVINAIRNSGLTLIKTPQGYVLQRIEGIKAQPLYTAPVHASDISQERVDETAKDRHEPVAWEGWVLREVYFSEGAPIGHREPQEKREWVGLSTGEAREFYESDLSREELIHKIDEFLEEKNT